MSIESVMPSSHLILCRPLLLLAPIPPRNSFESKMERGQWFFLGLRVVSLGIMWEPVAEQTRGHVLIMMTTMYWGFPGGSNGEESACNAGDLGLTPGLGSSPGEGNGNPLQILAWRIPWTEEPGGLQPMGLQKSWTRLSN